MFNLNASKCSYTIFSVSGRSDITLNLKHGNEPIPYCKNLVFLGITFDESLCFNAHYENLRARAIKRLNIIKIFSHSSWHLDHLTLKGIYRALIGSIFDYSFFSISNVSDTNIGRIQKAQNRTLRCIYKLPWDSHPDLLFPISNILPVKDRFLQLGCRYILKAIASRNPLIRVLINEYFSSKSEITKIKKLGTPLCMFFNLIGIAYSLIGVIVLSVFSLFFGKSSYLSHFFK